MDFGVTVILAQPLGLPRREIRQQDSEHVRRAVLGILGSAEAVDRRHVVPQGDETRFHVPVTGLGNPDVGEKRVA